MKNLLDRFIELATKKLNSGKCKEGQADFLRQAIQTLEGVKHDLADASKDRAPIHRRFWTAIMCLGAGGALEEDIPDG
ncbi:MAG TPA: hypothetical protein VJZ71_01910 [Phycisphaerae bacterium]|nr:hypothetical protein [Phycisphaerae bacterium]